MSCAFPTISGGTIPPSPPLLSFPEGPIPPDPPWEGLPVPPYPPGPRGRQHPPQRRRRAPVFTGEGDVLAVLRRAGRRTALSRRVGFGFRARDRTVQLGVVVDDAEQSCEA